MTVLGCGHVSEFATTLNKTNSVFFFFFGKDFIVPNTTLFFNTVTNSMLRLSRDEIKCKSRAFLAKTHTSLLQKTDPDWEFPNAPTDTDEWEFPAVPAKPTLKLLKIEDHDDDLVVVSSRS